jgi:hypothetical protein
MHTYNCLIAFGLIPITFYRLAIPAMLAPAAFPALFLTREQPDGLASSG